MRKRGRVHARPAGRPGVADTFLRDGDERAGMRILKGSSLEMLLGVGSRRVPESIALARKR